MESLTEREINALAKAFPPVHSATTLLRQAHIPVENLPTGEFMTPIGFWSEVARAIEQGLIKDGRQAILVAAHQRMPYNDVFDTVVIRTGSVLVIGSSPGGESPVRADRELKAILASARSAQLTVHSAPAASASDIEQILSLRPDILHLACHGDGPDLVFEDGFGRARYIAGRTIAEVLGLYQAHAGIRLRGVVLNACLSADLAIPFRSVADVVIAHRGPLDDECAVVFAGKLYAALGAVPSMAEAASIAAGNAMLEDETCGSLRDGLVVLTSQR